MMNTRQLLGNTILVFGLLATGTSFAEEAATTAPAKRTPERRQAHRAEMKAKWDSMTPEQRAKVKERRAERLERRAEHMEHRADHLKK